MCHSIVVKVKSECTCISVSSEASPTIWSCYANSNHYHYSFLQKLISYTVYKHRFTNYKHTKNYIFHKNLHLHDQMSGWLRHWSHKMCVTLTLHVWHVLVNFHSRLCQSQDLCFRWMLFSFSKKLQLLLVWSCSCQQTTTRFVECYTDTQLVAGMCCQGYCSSFG